MAVSRRPPRERRVAGVRGWDASRVAEAAGASLVSEASRGAIEPGPHGTTIDSRRAGPGDLFVGLAGERSDGGEYAVQALKAGAWGVLVAPEHARDAARHGVEGNVLAHRDPLAGLAALARSWRRELGARGMRVVAITGSTGKTSTKDILAAILSKQLRTAASPENFNTEIGLPLAILAAAGDTEVLVLEMAMRGAGQIAELTAIAEPEVGVIVNVGPVHLELLGTLEAIAGAKAELIAGLKEGTTIVIPVDEPLLAAHVRADLRTLTFGDGGDFALQSAPAGTGPEPEGEVVIREARFSPLPPRGGTDASAAAAGERIVLQPSFRQEHNVRNLLAAVAAARALGITPHGRVDVRFSALRGERLVLNSGVVLINDCYNANPMSMRAAIDDLAETAPARRVAVLGDMLELGPEASRFHREIGEHASARGVDLLVTVGTMGADTQSAFTGEAHSVADAAAAAELLTGLLRDGDTVLVKGSRGVGLERVAGVLGAGAETPGAQSAGASAAEPSAGAGQR
jgi:UDP-N-acetylmuramoyl-tripeptide--D-alanyl-D-alanine ligase